MSGFFSQLVNIVTLFPKATVVPYNHCSHYAALWSLSMLSSPYYTVITVMPDTLGTVSRALLLGKCSSKIERSR